LRLNELVLTCYNSLFVGSGQTLAIGGPAFLLAAYIVMSISVWLVVTAITEVAAYLPVQGASMSYYGDRYVSRSLGFAMGYLYWYSLGILVPYELTASSLVINYWPNNISVGVWITVMMVVIIALNFLPVSYYGESEFWFAGLKFITILGLLILSFILFWGGGPSRDRLGFRYWKHPGAANRLLAGGSTGYFISFWQCLVLAVFPFTFAPELLVATAGEMQSPRRNLPKASRRYFYRLVFFYVFSMLAIGVICPSDADDLTNGGAGAKSSPFVIAIRTASIDILPSIINAVILTSSWSAGNAFLYLSSRSLYSLAVQGNAPAILKTCNRWGVPYVAVGVTSLFSLLGYLNLATSSSIVFNWFINLTNTAGTISWICCSIIFLRFRKAAIVQGVEPPYRSWTQPYGAYFTLFFFSLLTLTNDFAVFWPANWSVSGFLTGYIGLPIFIAIYLGHRLVFWNDKWVRNVSEMDLQTGLGEIEDAEVPLPPRKGWKRVMKLIE
jgi:amino acid transporter